MSDDGENTADGIRGAAKPQIAETVIEVRDLSQDVQGLRPAFGHVLGDAHP